MPPCLHFIFFKRLWTKFLGMASSDPRIRTRSFNLSQKTFARLVTSTTDSTAYPVQIFPSPSFLFAYEVLIFCECHFVLKYNISAANINIFGGTSAEAYIFFWGAHMNLQLNLGALLQWRIFTSAISEIKFGSVQTSITTLLYSYDKHN